MTLEGPGQYASAVLGILVSVPNWLEAARGIADWMQARLDGQPFASERWFVEAGGRVVRTPYQAAQA